MRARGRRSLAGGHGGQALDRHQSRIYLQGECAYSRAEEKEVEEEEQDKEEEEEEEEEDKHDEIQRPSSACCQ